MATHTPEEERASIGQRSTSLRARLEERARSAEVERQKAAERIAREDAQAVTSGNGARSIDYLRARLQVPRAQSQQPARDASVRFPASEEPELVRLAYVLRDFDQTTCTCSEMPRAAINDIIQRLEAGRVPDEVISFIADEYRVEQKDVWEGRAPKFDKYPRLVDVHARVNAVMNIRYELGVIYRDKPRKDKPRKPIKRARL